MVPQNQIDQQAARHAGIADAMRNVDAVLPEKWPTEYADAYNQAAIAAGSSKRAPFPVPPAPPAH